MSSTYYLRPSEAAEIIGVTRETIRRWANSGKLKAHTTLGGHVRIERETVEELMKNNEVNVDGNGNGNSKK